MTKQAIAENLRAGVEVLRSYPSPQAVLNTAKMIESMAGEIEIFGEIPADPIQPVPIEHDETADVTAHDEPPQTTDHAGESAPGDGLPNHYAERASNPLPPAVPDGGDPPRRPPADV